MVPVSFHLRVFTAPNSFSISIVMGSIEASLGFGASLEFKLTIPFFLTYARKTVNLKGAQTS